MGIFKMNKSMNGNTSFELETSAEAEIGNITIVNKDGSDGGMYPLLRGSLEWTMGRGEDVDIRFKRPGVLDVHCKICLEGNEDGYKLSVTSFGPTYVNGAAIPSNTPKKGQIEQ